MQFGLSLFAHDLVDDQRPDWLGGSGLTLLTLVQMRRRLTRLPMAWALLWAPSSRTAASVTRALDSLAADGHSEAITPKALAGTSPYLNEHLNRFGSYELEQRKMVKDNHLVANPAHLPYRRRHASPWSRTRSCRAA